MPRRYTLRDVGLACSITAGCAVFLMTGKVHSKVAAGNFWQSSIYGVLLMLGYLGFDGFTSTFQDKMFKGYNMTTYNQILYTTLWSSILSFFALVSSGQLGGALAFVAAHPDALTSIMTLSLAATCGSLFISYTIKTFGALVFATIMTTRQFLSILLSCIIFVHPLSEGQWLGTLIVFATLYYQSFSAPVKAPKAAPAVPEEPAASEELEPLKAEPKALPA